MTTNMSSLDEAAFSAYALWEPRPIASQMQQPANTFDFKVILIAAKDLFPITDRYNQSTDVHLQLRVIDQYGHAIAPHFTYTSTIQHGPEPVWRESVLLKHLPTRPCQLQFKFYVKPNTPSDSQMVDGSNPGDVIGEVTVPNHILTHFYGDCSLIYSSWHRVTQSLNPSAQFHYVITPPRARLRHLTLEQSEPPVLSPVAQIIDQSINQTNNQSPVVPKQPLVVRTVSVDTDVSQIPIISTRQSGKKTKKSPSSKPPLAPSPESNSQSSNQTVNQTIKQSSTPSVRNGGAHTTHTSIDMGSSTPSNPVASPSLSLHAALALSPSGAHYEMLVEKEKMLTEEEKTKRDSMRERACAEFLNTERSYVTNLAILKNEFVDPLTVAVRDRTIDMKPEMLATIVNNIETLHAFHIQFLGELEQRGQASSAASIAATVNKYSQFFKLYISYVGQYEASLSAINSLRSNKPFQHFLAEMRDRLNEISILDLTSYLITPVQRVPRYVMLLNEIAKHTGPHSPDYQALQTALDAVKRVASYVNEGKRECENISKLVDVQERISGDRCPQLVAPARRFVLEAAMERVSHSMLHSAKLKTSYFFLFNDMILWANHNHAFKGAIQLVTASLDLKQKDKLILDITSAKHHLSMKFPNMDLYLQWAETIQSLIDELQRERNKNRVLYRDLKSRRRQMNGVNNFADSGSPSPSGEPSSMGPIAELNSSPHFHPTASPLVAEDDNVHSLITEKLRQLQMNKGDSQLDLQRENSVYSLNRRVSFAPGVPSTNNQSMDTTGFTPSHMYHPSLVASDSFPNSDSFANDDPSVSPPPGQVQSQSHSAGVLLHHHRQSQILRTLKAEHSASQSNMNTNQPPLLHTTSLLNPPTAIAPPTVTNLCLCLDRAEGKRNSIKMFDEDEQRAPVRCPLHSLPDDE